MILSLRTNILLRITETLNDLWSSIGELFSVVNYCPVMFQEHRNFSVCILKQSIELDSGMLNIITSPALNNTLNALRNGDI
jgi:hypothetical protein